MVGAVGVAMSIHLLIVLELGAAASAAASEAASGLSKAIWLELPVIL
jgi:hypothetical protein